MKKNYQTLALEIIVLKAQDVVTLSGFDGLGQEFEKPNGSDSTESQFLGV